MVKRLLLKAIRYYQVTGGSVQHFAISCNFSPTCSHYTYQAIERFGVTRGVLMGLKRIKRCSDPDCVDVTIDLVPSKSANK